MNKSKRQESTNLNILLIPFPYIHESEQFTLTPSKIIQLSQLLTIGLCLKQKIVYTHLYESWNMVIRKAIGMQMRSTTMRYACRKQDIVLIIRPLQQQNTSKQEQIIRKEDRKARLVKQSECSYYRSMQKEEQTSWKTITQYSEHQISAIVRKINQYSIICFVYIQYVHQTTQPTPQDIAVVPIQGTNYQQFHAILPAMHPCVDQQIGLDRIQRIVQEIQVFSRQSTSLSSTQQKLTTVSVKPKKQKAKVMVPIQYRSSGCLGLSDFFKCFSQSKKIKNTNNRRKKDEIEVGQGQLVETQQKQVRVEEDRNKQCKLNMEIGRRQNPRLYAVSGIDYSKNNKQWLLKLRYRNNL